MAAHGVRACCRVGADCKLPGQGGRAVVMRVGCLGQRQVLGTSPEVQRARRFDDDDEAEHAIAATSAILKTLAGVGGKVQSGPPTRRVAGPKDKVWYGPLTSLEPARW